MLAPNYTLPSEWPRPNPAEMRKLIEFLVPYVMWLDPKIIGQIVEHNEAHRTEWIQKLSQFNDINPEAYLWEQGACVFPGIRRATGGEDRSHFEAVDCLKTDTTNNHYPNITWGYLMIGKQKFNKKDKAETGLAHLFPHKDDSRDVLLAKTAATQYHPTASALEALESAEGADPGVAHAPTDYAHWLVGPDEAIEKLKQPYSLSGLFTSVTNMCFLPAELMKPTDVHGPLLLVLLLKAQDLYGQDGACNLLPYGLKLDDPDKLLSQSGIGLSWADVKKLGWTKRYTGASGNVKTLNSYRSKQLDKLIAQKKIKASAKALSA